MVTPDRLSDTHLTPFLLIGDVSNDLLLCGNRTIANGRAASLAFNHDDFFAPNANDATKPSILDFVAFFPVIFHFYFSPVAKVKNVFFCSPFFSAFFLFFFSAFFLLFFSANVVRPLDSNRDGLGRS